MILSNIIVEFNKDLRYELKNEANVKNVIYYDENITLNHKGNSYKTIGEDS